MNERLKFVAEHQSPPVRRSTSRFPSDPALRGARLYAQWLVLDPAGGMGSTTRGLDVTVQ